MTTTSPFVLLLTPDEQVALRRYVDGMMRVARREAIEECIAVVGARARQDGGGFVYAPALTDAFRALLEREGE